PPRKNPSAPRLPRGRKGSSLPRGRVLLAPAGEAREKCHTERMRAPLPRAPFPPGSARDGRLGSLRSRWSRSRSRSRRACTCRSSSVVPPQTPCSWCVARAYWRHWGRTRQAAQTAFALAVSPAPGPRAVTGKNSSGSASRQAAERHQSRRSSASAARWAGSWVMTMRRPPNRSCPRVTGDSLLRIGNTTYTAYLYGHLGSGAHDRRAICRQAPIQQRGLPLCPPAGASRIPMRRDHDACPRAPGAPAGRASLGRGR
ncbi:MAG: hypothetical protein QOH87_1819, partial [Trebonia sp.]|nr:hypothetical protein [Trebonia sp.]